jgi:hypothetical protein
MSRDKSRPRIKNQHLVPQFYLRHFCSAQGRLFAFDKPQQKVFCTTPNGVGSSQLFYDLPASFLKHGADPQIVEKTLAAAETRYSASLSKVIGHLDEHSILPDGERGTIAEFVAVQAFRTRDVRATLQQIGQLTDLALKEEGGGPYRSMDDDTELPFIQAMLMFKGGAPEAKNILMNHIWVIARNMTPFPLYTSDSPVLRIPHITDDVMGYGGLGSLGIEVCFPLSPTYLLIMLERTYHTASAANHLQCAHNLVPENITYYNGHQVLASDRQLYSVSDYFDVARDVIKVRPDVCDPERQRSRFIWGGRDFKLPNNPRNDNEH